ncbi:hypothetical protein O3Q51_06600 [Cryomorphaceae bacterium 1068]|nr:hypothetical protein [Cryomorphaceae bacterium 1068]
MALAQGSTIAAIEQEQKHLYGLDKLKALNTLAQYYFDLDESKAYKYAKQAAPLGDQIFVESNTVVDQNQRYEQVSAHLLLGKILYRREDFFDSRESLLKAKSIAIEINHMAYKNEADDYLIQIQELIDSGEIKESLFSKTFGDIKVGRVIDYTANNIAIQTEVKKAELKENKGDYQGAIDNYKQVINLLRNEGDSERIKLFQLKIAALLDSLDEHVEAQKFLNDAILEIEIQDQFDSSQKASVSTLSTMDSETISEDSLNAMRQSRSELKRMAGELTSKEQYDEALIYEKMYHELSRKIETDSLKLEVEKTKTNNEIILLKQQKRIADLNVNEIEREKEKQKRFKNILLMIALLIFGSAVVIYYFYSAKRKEHQKLTITYNELDHTKSKLVSAEKKITNLLKEQLSGDIATELMQHGTDGVGKKRFVCIMFLDIRGFTPIAEKMSPEKLISFQNTVFGPMIEAVEQNHGNINQLLGDGFMATFGAPISHGNDCQNALLTAKQILTDLADRIKKGLIPEIKIGIGLHAGDVVTGNVGSKTRRQYSVTGNPVIIASRVEQLNKEYGSQLIFTEEVYTQLESFKVPEEGFAEVFVKGRSEPIKILKFKSADEMV